MESELFIPFILTIGSPTELELGYYGEDYNELVFLLCKLKILLSY